MLLLASALCSYLMLTRVKPAVSLNKLASVVGIENDSGGGTHSAPCWKGASLQLSQDKIAAII